MQPLNKSPCEILVVSCIKCTRNQSTAAELYTVVRTHAMKMQNIFSNMRDMLTHVYIRDGELDSSNRDRDRVRVHVARTGLKGYDSC
jgi:hypothetical protein